jgi:SPP1 family predicted phage head-tail adaptor
MQAQRYRHRVEFQRKTETQDMDTGAISHEWATVYLDSDTPLDSVPAEVLTGPGREFNAADAKQAETTARIQCRWFPGLLPTWRLIWDSKTYDILSIETDATARREYRMRCREGVSDGD